MVTSALVRFTTTPEQPPGHAAFLAPLLVNRSSKELEMSVQVSAAWVERAANVRVQHKINAAPQWRAVGSLGRIIGFIGVLFRVWQKWSRVQGHFAILKKSQLFQSAVGTKWD
jgi:hypothetical protein